MLSVLGLIAAIMFSAPNSPLALHPENPHYFLFRGKPTILVTSGEHYGAVLNSDFDYVKYLDTLRADGLNLTRTFTGAAYVEPHGAFKIKDNTLAPAEGRYLAPWARSDQPGNLGGGNKFDLAKWNPEYFRRFHHFVAQAGERGIIVEVNLFCPFYEDSQWRLSPFHPSNNVNGLGKLARTDVYTLDKHGGLLAIQDAFVRKIAVELKDFDNIYYEICNEPYFGGVTLAWQHHIADVIVSAESSGSRHLISQNIANGSAKIEKPHPAVSIFNFHYATPPDTVPLNYGLGKLIGDNETGFAGTADAAYRMEGWDFLLAGGGLLNNLDYSFTVGKEDGTAVVAAPTPGGGSAALRRQLRFLKEFVEGCDFIHMKPDNSIFQGEGPAGMTARALVVPGKEYGVYLRPKPKAKPVPRPSEVVLRITLPAGKYHAEWFDPEAGKSIREESFEHPGGECRLQAPVFRDDLTLRIRRTENAVDHASKPGLITYSPQLVAELVASARASGDARRGAMVFQSAQFACLSCHKVGNQGGTVGPELTTIGRCQPPEKTVESVLWPRREVKEGYSAIAVFTTDGKTCRGYKEREDEKELVLRDPATGVKTAIAKSLIEARREIGTLMPDGLAEAMSPEQRRDVIRFLMDLGRPGGASPDALLAHGHRPATFPYDRAPLHPEQWPHWQQPVNRDRLYDFYAKEAEYFAHRPEMPLLLPEFPGLDGGKYGHWGNQNEETWADDRWNQTDLGSLQCGVFHGPSVTVARGVCVRLGERGELATCFNPDTLCYEALWQGGFVKFSSVRHGFLDGLRPSGTPLPRPEGQKPDQPFVYHGFFRHGQRVIFSYRVGDVEILDAPWAEGGKFVRTVAPAASHPLAALVRGGPAQWPRVLETRGTLGSGGAYVIDTVVPPFENPWRAPCFFGDHDFFPDGTAMICTMQGDVWRVDGLDDTLEHVRWRRFASGLHHALGLVVADGKVYVLGRDQITRLHDFNRDGEADFYESFSNAYVTSSAGHDFICGLQRDASGQFYTASGKQGLLRISADGRRADVLATGFRNPDGLGLLPDGSLTVPCSEGEWTPASMICQVARESNRSPRIGGHLPPYFGYGGPKNDRAPDLPLVYLPRGLDNSSGAQVAVTSDRWGPLQGQLIHLSYGAGTHFLVLREEVAGQPQGAVVPLPGDFLSGVHRGRFNPKDGQLYVSGMGGWGTYTVADGCFQRVRYTGRPVLLPIVFHAHQNGVLVSFTEKIDSAIAGRRESYFAQAWNYRYSSGYGSAEFSARHPGVRGHDPVIITAAHVLADGRTVFLEMPDLQPVNQLHLHMRVDSGPALDLYATVHELGSLFTAYPDYRPSAKTIAAHPILGDLVLAAKSVPNPWRKSLHGARPIAIEAAKNLTFSTRTITVRAGEPIKLTFTNPDVVPHNWVLIRPGSLERVGDLANKLVAEPDAAARQYVPASNDVLAFTDIVQPEESFSISFRAPAAKGRYPFLCTFPGHWMIMNGEMIVE